MTIYDFITTCCDCGNINFSIFDCNTEKHFDISGEDLRFSKWEDYEIGGMDIWCEKDGQKVHVEFNIEIEEGE